MSIVENLKQFVHGFLRGMKALDKHADMIASNDDIQQIATGFKRLNEQMIGSSIQDHLYSTGGAARVGGRATHDDEVVIKRKPKKQRVVYIEDDDEDDEDDEPVVIRRKKTKKSGSKNILRFDTGFDFMYGDEK